MVQFVVVLGEWVDKICSSMAMCCSTEPDLFVDLARDAFVKTEVAFCPPTIGHTHPTAAANRTSAREFALTVAATTGNDLFSLGMSKSDQRKGIRGSRKWRWAKDTNAEVRSDVPAPRDVIFICDVDYYLDMPYMLATSPSTRLIYTSVPEDAGAERDNATTYFESDGSLTTIVSGGGSYNHLLWDYGSDSLVAKEHTLGLLSTLTTYAIERKQVAYGRQVILLTPIKVFRWVGAWVASWILDDKPLTRFAPIVSTQDGDFVRFNVQRPDGLYVTTGYTGTPYCATVPIQVDGAIASSARLSNVKLMRPTVESWLGEGSVIETPEKRVELKRRSAILTEYHRTQVRAKHPFVFPVEHAVRNYQFEPHNYDENAKPKLQAFMAPLLHAAFAPDNIVSSERQAKKGRVTRLQKPEPKPCHLRERAMREFAALVCNGEILSPIDAEEVAEHQTRPSQKKSINAACVAGPKIVRVLKAHIKGEAYGKLTDPRIITEYPDGDKLTMATFARAMAAHLKQFPWYGPGKTPLEIASRVADICADAQFVNVSDLHRMDGTITHALRMVDRYTMMRAFSRDQAVLNELLNRNVGNTTIFPNGTTFKQGSTHGSGCSATSVFQTLRAAFATYFAFRCGKSTRQRYPTPRHAFEAIGIHFGDDGLDADLPVDDHRWACDRVGLVLESGIVERGDPGVNFLARYYSPEVWYGSLNSMCDVRRQLSKLHTTTRLPNNVSPLAKLVEKAMSFVATDPNTPVIGEFCRKVLLLTDFRPKVHLGVGTWWGQYADSVQYPNTNVGGWMDALFATHLPEFSRGVFNDWMAKVQRPGEMLRAPLCQNVTGPQPGADPAVVDGRVVYPLCTTTSAEPIRTTEDTRASEVSSTVSTSSDKTVGKADTSVTNGHKPRSRTRASRSREPTRRSKRTPGRAKTTSVVLPAV